MKKLTGAALAALILTGGLLMAQTSKFDRAAWTAVAGKPEDSAPRAEMLEAAMAQIPAGTSQDDVLAALGEPDKRFDAAWAYMTSPTLFGGEYRALLVNFDAEGKVVSAKEVSSETWQ